jgi:tetratricopeptide (TPR) repeat protein
MGKYDGLQRLGEQAEDLARELNDGRRLAQVQVRHAQAIALSGVFPGTLQSALERAREAYARAAAHDLRTRSYARLVAGDACRSLGRMSDAVEEFDEGLALLKPLHRQGDDLGLVLPIYVSLCAWRSEAHAATGDFDQALASAREGLLVATEIRHLTSLTVANRYLGYVHVLHGQIAESVPVLERALTIASEQELFHATIFSSCYLAYARVLLGHRPQALELLERALKMSAAVITPRWHYYAATAAAAYLAAGCPEEARAIIHAGQAEGTERRAQGYRPTWLRLEAQALSGESATISAERLREALALADALGLRPEAAQCHAELAKLYRRVGKRIESDAHITTATTMYREMGMTYWLARTNQEMES